MSLWKALRWWYILRALRKQRERESRDALRAARNAGGLPVEFGEPR
jgi:hypothetical protein